MKKYSIVIFLVLFFCHSIMAQENSIKKYIPENWKIIQKIKGDLNKDKKDDLVLIIEETDATKVLKNDGLGAQLLNTNPRGIMVFFNDNNKYTLISKNLKGFIPSENDVENPCLEDPLNLVEIEKNILIINFNYWLSCGSWYVNNATYKFRYQNNSFELIGFDHSEFHRASGESKEKSINFSTKEQIITTGLNVFDGKDNPKMVKSKIKINKLYKLKECQEDIYFNFVGR